MAVTVDATRSPRTTPRASLADRLRALDRPLTSYYLVLTSSLLLFMIFVAYLLLRRFGGPGSDKLGAGMALFGMANVPFIYVSVNYWRTIHPPTTVVPTLPVEMGIPLWFCVTAFTLLFIVLLRLRARLEHQRARVEALYLAEDDL